MTQQNESALRRRWVPALPEDDLPGAGESPRSVGLFGEELIAFRQPDGRIGVIGGYCPHEGAPLYDGRIHLGARCSLHGWEFDAFGRRCDPYPASREAGVAAYQARASGGLIWVLLGSGKPAEPELKSEEPDGVKLRWQLRAFPASLKAVSAAVLSLGAAAAEHDWPAAFTLPAQDGSDEACTLLLVPRNAGRTTVLCAPVCRDQDVIAISRAIAAA